MPYNTLKAGIDWSYESYKEYLNLLERKKLAINVCSYIGHSAVRIWSMGEAAMEKEATESEIIEMEKIVRDAMSNGAIGFSTSTFEGHNGDGGRPMPSRLSSNDEMSRLVKLWLIRVEAFLCSLNQIIQVLKILKILWVI